MSEPNNLDAMAHEFAKLGRVMVLHRPTLAVGRVSRVYMSGEYTGSNGRAVTVPAVALEDGNVFLFDPFAFAVLGLEGAQFYEAAQNLIGASSRSTMGFACAMGLDMETSVLLLRSVLSAQLRELGTKGEPGEQVSG